MSRYISKESNKTLAKETGLTCAFCSDFIYERHHIEPYSLTGDNSPENLILLCPSCHTKAHKGDISKEDLVGRKKALQGYEPKGIVNIPVERSINQLELGNNWILIDSESLGDFDSIISFNHIPVLVVRNEDNRLICSLRAFSHEKKLVFFMSKNLAWIDLKYFKDFQSTRNRIVLISNSDEEVFHIELRDDTLSIYGETYFDGRKICFDEDGIHFEHSSISFKHLSYANVNTEKIKRLTRSTLLLSEGAKTVLTLGDSDKLAGLPKSCIKMEIHPKI